MNQYLKTIQDLLQGNHQLSEQDKLAVLKTLADADKQWSITEFKLDRTEKVKRTTTILLEETIQELEQKRKAVEVQNLELEIEAALEKVRSRSLAMYNSNELGNVVTIVFEKLKDLNVISDKASATIFTLTEGSKDIVHWSIGPMGGAFNVLVPYTNHPILTDFWDARESGKNFTAKTYSDEIKKTFFQWALVHSGYKQLPDDIKKWILESPGEGYGISSAWFEYSGIFISSYNGSLFSEKDNDILKRFAKVFEQCYIRFLDLQKAEVQARESLIQLAMERVRARTMAMQRSDELVDAASLLFKQLEDLGIKSWSSGFNIWQDDGRSATINMCNPDGSIATPYYLPHTKDIFFIRICEARKRGEDLLVMETGGKELEDTYNYMFSLPEVRKVLGAMEDTGFQIPKFQVNHCAFFSQGYLMFITYEPVPEMWDVFKRLAKVFEQTYTRFLDLQTAEAQARESQIQLAMERVRARTMAMQRSDELSEAASLLFQQVQSLGAPSWTAGYCIWDEDKKAITLWMSSPSGGIQPPFRAPLDENPTFIRYLEADNKGMELYIEEESGKVPEENYQYLLTLPVVGELLNAIMKEGYPLPTYQVDHCAYFSKGFLLFITYQQVPELHDIFKRFAAVFDQTYTRFLDLQKAEAQAKEAQIEAALERVRSRSMGMQKSEELKEVIQVVYEQFVHLNIKIEHTGFVMDYKARDDYDIWIADPLGVPSQITVPYFDSVYYNRFNEAKEKGEDFFATNLSFEEKNKFYQKLFEYIPGLPEQAKEFYFSCPGLAASTVLLDNVCLYIENFSGTPYTDEDNNTLMRFGKVFQQTYTRFLDLQKAETQVREAKIEAGLERVRYSAMAMQSSEDVGAATAVVFHEIALLGVETMRCCITILHPDMTADVWAATATNDGKDMKGRGSINFNDHPLWVGLFDAWKNKAESFSFELKGDDLKTYYKALANSPNYDSSYIQNQEFPDHFLYASFFDQGAVFTFSLQQHDDNKRNILKRFTAVFSLTFRRYLDLQKAEAQALEAVKRASVDRVRAEIASMRSTNDLERITPLIWNEFTTLGVPFIRCGVFIMDEELQKVHTFLSTPEGKAIATMHVPFEFDLTIITNGVKYWRKKKVYTEHWNADTFTSTWIKLSSLRETSIESPQREHPPESLYLHMLPFLQGMLYVGNDTPLNEDALQLVQNLADAFSTAYARYEDFNKLEAAKKQVDSTLNELQATQKQLIQSEKMASLGELTAGIAHEIQNPLNFVNNFSEVNKELLAELNEEIEKGNYEEVKIIAADIAGNEEKISHHGKRADSIVKGMLQHSRTTSTTKEPTDINSLADEYLRLAYHGLRAKDKSFNATMKTDYDETIGKINIIPQDIGRVILNVITNAFYSVNEKKKVQGDGYEPTVSLSTKKIGDTIEIKVADNGNGIPQKVVEKIFQPFFTTKPTGQGTGLGLSLAYDIVKVHGGEIKVETNEGEGTEFLITIPIKSN